MTAPEIVFVKLPEKLDGDPLQLSSVPKYGAWKEVGRADLSGDDVYDPTLEEQIAHVEWSLGGYLATHTWLDQNLTFGKSLNAYIKQLAMWPWGASRDAADGLERIRDHRDELLKVKGEGYQLVRQQRFEYVDTKTVSFGDTKDFDLEVTLGTVHQTAHETSETVGMTFGTATTKATGVEMNVGLEFEGVGKIGGSVKHSRSETTTMEIARALQVEKTETSVATSSRTTKVHDEITGGETGARYVVWQIADWIQLIRNHDNVVVSDSKVRSFTQRLKYPYDTPH